MVTLIVLIALIGTLKFNSAISAAINYEPIKITVNENFNAQPGQISPELQEPGVLHQGANFYFKPQLNIPPSYIPSHIEALISLIQQHRHSCAKDTSKVVVEKVKLIEILKPFMNPLSDISKETLSEIVLQKENISEIVKPIVITEESKPVTLVIPEAPVLTPTSFNAGIPSFFEEEVKKGESVILEEPTGVFSTIPEIAVRPISEPFINYVEPKPTNAELVVIPEAPVLPPLSANDIHVVEEEVKMEEPIVVDVEPKPTIQELVEIPEAPVLPSLSLHDVSSIIEEEVKKEELIKLEEPTGIFPTIPKIDVRPIEEPILNYVEPKPSTSELVVIPEAPVLPPLTFNGLPSMVEEVKKEESIILEESTGAFPTITEIATRPITEPIINYGEPKPSTSGLVVIPEAPVLPPLSLNDIHGVEEEVKIEEPIIVDVEPKPITSELVAIPEAPVLPSLSLHDVSSIIEKEIKKEESITLEEPTGMFPTIPKIDVRPIEEPILNYVEPKPITSELVVIPEAPVLPPLTLNGFPSVVEEEVKKEESIILEESTGAFPTITEIVARPITEPNIHYGEPKPSTLGLVVIPEAPVLPSLSLHEITSNIEKVKKEESIILKEPTGVFPTIPEIDVRPIEEPFINYVKPKPITSELAVIPEAPVLPPLTLNGFPPVVEEEGKKEESIILEESTGAFPTITEIAACPITEPIINYGEPKPSTSGLVVIPEAPVLPPLSLNDIHVVGEVVKIEEPIIVNIDHKPAIQELVEIPEAPVLPSLSLHDISSIIEKEIKKEESITLEEPTGMFPTIPKIDVRPIEEPILNYVEPKPITSELVVIPEAPVLPPLTLNGFPSVVEEEVKKEESIILEESTGAFPTITEIATRPITEPIINYGEPKPSTSGLVVIPEAPVLPPLSLNDIHGVEEEVKIEEPIIVDVEPKPITSELLAIPEAPVLPSFSVHDISAIMEEEVKQEGSIILEEPTGLFPTIPEIAARPIAEPIINYSEPKPSTLGLLVIPEAPVLPPLSLNDIHDFGEVAKLEEPIIVDVEPKRVIQELVEIPEALPSLSLHETSSIMEEEVKKEESIILAEPTGVFPTIPEEVIPEALVLPPLSYNGISPVVEEVKVEESTGVFHSIPEISARPFPEPLENQKLSETAESFALENNIFPVATEEVKIEIPILLEESIDVFPSIAEISSGSTLQASSPEITDSYVLEEVSQPKPESVVTDKETLPPKIIVKPSNHLGVFSYVPFVSHLSYNRAPKTKKLMIPKPASLERFLLKKHHFRLPVTPFPKLEFNAIKSSIWGNKKQFLYPTSYAHEVVEKRIAPNMAFKKQNAPKRVKIYIRSNVPKGPSYL